MVFPAEFPDDTYHSLLVGINKTLLSNIALVIFTVTVVKCLQLAPADNKLDLGNNSNCMAINCRDRFAMLQMLQLL